MRGYSILQVLGYLTGGLWYTTWGGGTFDVTVVSYTPTRFQVLATDGDVHLGGVDWNNRLLDFVADKFVADHGVDPRESEAAAQLLHYQSW